MSIPLRRTVNFEYIGRMNALDGEKHTSKGWFKKGVRMLEKEIFSDFSIGSLVGVKIKGKDELVQILKKIGKYGEEFTPEGEGGEMFECLVGEFYRSHFFRKMGFKELEKKYDSSGKKIDKKYLVYLCPSLGRKLCRYY